jgi:hypothetical protein
VSAADRSVFAADCFATRGVGLPTGLGYVLLGHAHRDHSGCKPLVAQQTDCSPSGQRIRRERVPAQIVLPTAHESRGAVGRQLHLVHPHVPHGNVADRSCRRATRDHCLQARQATDQCRPEVLHALQGRPGDEGDADREVADHRLARDRARIDRGCGLQGQRLGAGAQVRRSREIVGRVDRGHVVEDGVERRPELDPDEHGGVALEGQHRLTAAGEQEQQHEQREHRVGHRLDHVAENRQGLLGHLAVVEPGRVLLGRLPGPGRRQAPWLPDR